MPSRFLPISPLSGGGTGQYLPDFGLLGGAPQAGPALSAPAAPTQRFVPIPRGGATQAPLPDFSAMQRSSALGQGAQTAGLASLGTGLMNRAIGGNPVLDAASPGLGVLSSGLGIGAIATNPMLSDPQKVTGSLSSALGGVRSLGSMPGIDAAVPGLSRFVQLPLGALMPASAGLSQGLSAAESAAQFGEAATGVGEGLGAAVGNIPLLGALGTGLNIATTALSDMPDEQKATNAFIDAAGLGLAGPTAGISMAAAPLLKMFLGSESLGLFKKDVPHAVREQLEANRALQSAGGLAQSVMDTGSVADIYKMLTHNTSGYLGGSSRIAVGTQFGYPKESGGPGVLPDDLITDMLAKGQIIPRRGLTPEQIMAESRTPVIGEQQNILNASTVTPEGFARLMKEHPELLVASTQAGVTPGKLTAGNDAVANAIRAQVKALETLGPLYTQMRQSYTAPSYGSAGAYADTAPPGFQEFVTALRQLPLETASMSDLVSALGSARVGRAQSKVEAAEQDQRVSAMHAYNPVVGGP